MKVDTSLLGCKEMKEKCAVHVHKKTGINHLFNILEDIFYWLGQVSSAVERVDVLASRTSTARDTEEGKKDTCYVTHMQFTAGWHKC